MAMAGQNAVGLNAGFRYTSNDFRLILHMLCDAINRKE